MAFGMFTMGTDENDDKEPEMEEETSYPDGHPMTSAINSADGLNMLGLGDMEAMVREHLLPFLRPAAGVLAVQRCRDQHFLRTRTRTCPVIGVAIGISWICSSSLLRTLRT
jgi:hypothetical protein